MENYYEFLKIDMTASQDDIVSAINNRSLLDNIDQAKIREIKSILLNEATKKIYDGKLVNFILNKNKAPTLFNSEKMKEVFNIDNLELHNKLIWVAIALFIVGILSGFFFGVIVNYTINMFIMIALLILFYMDWKLLEKHGKANFSKWWMLISPVYIFKRCKAINQGKKLFFIWIAIIFVHGLGTAIFSGGTAVLEHSACNVVTDIYHTQLRQYSKTCKNVTITESQGKHHYGFAELSDGSTRDISVSETPNGQIYVRLE